MGIDNINIEEPTLIVETEKTVVKGNYGYFSAKVVKTAEKNKYKVGDTVFADANNFVTVCIDGEHFENLYFLSEGTVKGSIEKEFKYK